MTKAYDSDLLVRIVKHIKSLDGSSLYQNISPDLAITIRLNKLAKFLGIPKIDVSSRWKPNNGFSGTIKYEISILSYLDDSEFFGDIDRIRIYTFDYKHWYLSWGTLSLRRAYMERLGTESLEECLICAWEILNGALPDGQSILHRKLREYEELRK